MRASASILNAVILSVSTALASAKVCIRDEEDVHFSESEFTAMATVTGIGASRIRAQMSNMPKYHRLSGMPVSWNRARAGTALPSGSAPLIAPHRATPPRAGASTSILGSSFIIFSYFYFPQLRTLAYKLIVYLSVTDLFSSFAYVLGTATRTQADCKDGWCYFTAIMSQYFDVATFCWCERR